MKTNSIITTANEEFSYEDQADMAFMIYRRFGRDVESAANAWRKLMSVNCYDVEFLALAKKSQNFYWNPFGPG